MGKPKGGWAIGRQKDAKLCDFSADFGALPALSAGGGIAVAICALHMRR
jgi:hypothetical protein